MKRSEANKIYKKRIEFSKIYDAFSVEDEEPEFNRNGCECCESLACDTFHVTALSRRDMKNKNFDDIYEFNICNGCIVSLINNDDSDLDYYVTEEDVG